jgi:hypothetical protein
VINSKRTEAAKKVKRGATLNNKAPSCQQNQSGKLAVTRACRHTMAGGLWASPHWLSYWCLTAQPLERFSIIPQEAAHKQPFKD